MKTVIVYDDDSLKLKQYQIDNSIDTKNYNCLLINKKDENIQYNVDYGLDLLLLEKDRKIELDPTTMEIIYRHNKELDDKQLSNNIKNKEAKIKKLEDNLEKLLSCVNFYKDNITKFIDSSENSFLDYIKEEYNLYEDYSEYY